MSDHSSDLVLAASLELSPDDIGCVYLEQRKQLLRGLYSQQNNGNGCGRDTVQYHLKSPTFSQVAESTLLVGSS